MKKRFISILLAVIIMSSLFCIQANAATAKTLYATTNATYDGVEKDFTFNTVEGCKYVSLFFVGKNATTANGGYFYTIIWHKENLTLTGAGKVTCSTTFYYTKTATIEDAHEIIFGENMTSIDVQGTGTSIYVFQPIILDAYTGTAYTGNEGDKTIMPSGIEKYYIDNIYVGETTEDETMSEDAVEALNNINKNIVMIQYTLIFILFIHFSEKWLKISFEANKRSGRV